jgi:hypothetical protein
MEIQIHPRQAKMDALLAAIKSGADEKVITTKCKALNLADFPMILMKLCLKPELKTVGEDKDENVTIKDGDDDDQDTTGQVVTDDKDGDDNDGNRGATVVIVDENAATAVQSTVVVKRLWSKPSYLSVVKSGFDNKQTKETIVTPTEKICRKLMDTGACEDKKNCQHLHPVKCSYYAGFGLARLNPKGCKSADCKFLHVVICRFKYKALCKKQLCSLQHLQPKAVEKKAKVQPEFVHHQPKETPVTATPTGSFLDQGLDQRMSRIESLLMMMMIPSQQRLSGWPHGTLEGAYSKN